MRILVLGAAGQVGFELCRTLACIGQVQSADRLADPGAGIDYAVDMADAAQLRGLLDTLAPDIIVNAAAYTAVDRAEDEPLIADQLNHLAVAGIATYAAAHAVLVVHYSTDYVFAGDGQAPYREQHRTAPRSVYGRTKLAGEQALAASGCDYLLLRTAWVYGARGANFLLTMLRLARTRPELAVVDDQIGSPTTARYLAQLTSLMLLRWIAADSAERAALVGCYHAVMDGAVSWHGFARAIIGEAHALGLLAQAPAVRAIQTADYPAKAPRPAYSVLDCTKLRERFDCVLPPWQQGLQHTLNELVQARRSLQTIEVPTC